MKNINQLLKCYIKLLIILIKQEYLEIKFQTKLKDLD
jgi:hypothetical protein